MAACSSADLGAGAAITDSLTIEVMVRGYHMYKDVSERAYKNNRSLRCGSGEITCYRWSYTKEDIFNMLHVPSVWWNDHLSSESI